MYVWEENVVGAALVMVVATVKAAVHMYVDNAHDDLALHWHTFST